LTRPSPRPTAQPTDSSTLATVTETVGELLDRASSALEALGLLGEEIEDEWSFVTDLVAAQQERFGAIAQRRGPESAVPSAVAAIERAVAETQSIADPHRAIDWLSTFPDLVALALDEPVGGA
jgi:hypothetical protein